MAPRRPVTSPYTALLLLLLMERPHTSVELAWETGLRPSQVNAYLHYYKQRGITWKNGVTWQLTDAGRRFVEESYNYLRRIVNSTLGIKLNKVESRKTNSNKVESRKTKLKKLAREWMGESLRDCWIIVDFLIFLYFERGRTYFETAPGKGLEDSLALALEDWGGGGSSSSYVSPTRVRDCLIDLHNRGIIYIYNGRKVRLSRILIEKAWSI